MAEFLIVLPLPDEHNALFEGLIKTAVAFLETVGVATRNNLGVFTRGIPKRPRETLRLVSLATATSDTAEQSTVRARTLEGVLRSTLAAAGVQAPDLRVFASTLSREVTPM